MSNTSYNIASHNGKLTIQNPKTGNHRTFSIHTQPKDSHFAPEQRIISLLIGSDNQSAYTPFGFVQSDGSIRLFRSKSEGVYPIYADMISNPVKWTAKGAVYMFEGRCRKCNRLLTSPESISSGIGPVCDGKSVRPVRHPYSKARYRRIQPQLIPTCP